MSILIPLSRRQFILSSLAVGLLPGQYAFAAPDSPGKFAPFSFVLVSDCHLINGQADSYKLTQESQLFLQDAVKQINTLSPDFVIFAGDQVDSPGEEDKNWQLFLDIVQSLDCAWHFVLGETDIAGTDKTGMAPISKMRTYGRDWRGRGLNNNAPYWSCDPLDGVHLIGLDTSKENSPTGDISDEQLLWLKQDLAVHSSALTIVVSHHPLLPPAPFNTDPNFSQYLLPQAPLTREILGGASGQVLALSGHVHVSKIDLQKNVCYISSPSLDIYPCAFRRFIVTPEKVDIETHQVNFPALVKKAKSNLLDSNLAASLSEGSPRKFVDIVTGTHLDQNASLSLTDQGCLVALKKAPILR